MVDRRTLQELADFVGRRADDDLRRAHRTGDVVGREWAAVRRELVVRMRRDLDERPYARAEVGNYLLRAARIRRDHPDFRDSWA